MRTIKFKLKNGKTVIIRRIRAKDYEDVMKFLEKFSSGPGAKWTNQYKGQPKKDYERSVAMYESDDSLFIGVWDGDEIVATTNISKMMAHHPYYARTAQTGTTVLEEYTSQGIGNKLKQLTEKWAKENDIHKLEATVRDKNIRSIGNLLKNGYEIVGILHDTAYIDGQWYNEYIMEKILESR